MIKPNRRTRGLRVVYNPGMKPLVISCSLNPGSRSAKLAAFAHEVFGETSSDVQLVDLRQTPLPICDGGAAYQQENVAPMSQLVVNSDPILLTVPIYNYDVNAAAKNLIELTGRSWTNKVVGFICAAGGQGSYMSVMSLANSLMLDFRCLIVPRFVYATGDHFEGDDQLNEAVMLRTRELCETSLGLAEAMQGVRVDPAR